MAEKLDRRALCRAVLADRGDMLVIAGLGAPAWDITAVGDCAENLPLWGGMGGACMIGLGLAIAQPDRRVLVITGDGEMLMGVGGLATIAVKAPKKSFHSRAGQRALWRDRHAGDPYRPWCGFGRNGEGRRVQADDVRD